MAATLYSRSHASNGQQVVGDNGVLSGASSYALSSAFSWVSAGSASNAGRAIAVVFTNEQAGNLTDVYINVSSFSGTWTSTDQMVQVGLYNASTVARCPGSQIHVENLTLSGSTTGWYHLTLATPQSLSAYNPYYIVISDSDGGATNYVTLNVGFGTTTGISGTTINTTTTGWASNAGGSGIGTAPLIAAKINGVMFGANPMTTVSTISSTTLPFGNAVQFTQNVDIVGLATWTSQAATWEGSTVGVWKSTTLPQSTPDASYGPLNATLFSLDSGYMPLAPYTLLANTLYIVGLIPPSGGLAVPRQISSNGGLDANLKLLFPNQGNFYRAYQTSSGTNTWSYDTTTYMQLALVINQSNASGSGVPASRQFLGMGG